MDGDKNFKKPWTEKISKAQINCGGCEQWKKSGAITAFAPF